MKHSLGDVYILSANCICNKTVMGKNEYDDDRREQCVLKLYLNENTGIANIRSTEKVGN